jgi:hypothetical protein
MGRSPGCCEHIVISAVGVAHRLREQTSKRSQHWLRHTVWDLRRWMRQCCNPYLQSESRLVRLAAPLRQLGTVLAIVCGMFS